MERLVNDFIEFASAFAKFAVLKGRLGTRLYLHAVLRLP